MFGVADWKKTDVLVLSQLKAAQDSPLGFCLQQVYFR